VKNFYVMLCDTCVCAMLRVYCVVSACDVFCAVCLSCIFFASCGMCWCILRYVYVVYDVCHVCMFCFVRPLCSKVCKCLIYDVRHVLQRMYFVACKCGI